MQVKIIAQHAHMPARVLEIVTAHGRLETPVFMPVGTRAGVNNLTPAELWSIGSQIILGGNTMHMLHAPGMPIIESAGGMHAWMGWHGPMLTDSGGFQVFSLSKQGSLCEIDEGGAHFKISENAPSFYMTPEVSLETQKIIGADIIMAFDQCTPSGVSLSEAAKIMRRTHRWLTQSVQYHREHPLSRHGDAQALFGIIQGGLYDDLRRDSADFVRESGVDGIALGGEAIGFDMAKTVDIIHSVRERLPRNQPRYTMGVGLSPNDLLAVIAAGIDMFDCVAPTRNARHGALYAGTLIEHQGWLTFESEFPEGRLSIKKAQFSQDPRPLMADCRCYTCQHHSRAYLHQLFKEGATAFTALASLHNVQVMHAVCERARQLIKAKTNPDQIQATP